MVATSFFFFSFLRLLFFFSYFSLQKKWKPKKKKSLKNACSTWTPLRVFFSCCLDCSTRYSYIDSVDEMSDTNENKKKKMKRDWEPEENHYIMKKIVYTRFQKKWKTNTMLCRCYGKNGYKNVKVLLFIFFVFLGAILYAIVSHSHCLFAILLSRPPIMTVSTKDVIYLMVFYQGTKKKK